MAAKILIKLNSEWVNEDSLDNVRIDASAWAAYTSQSSPLKVSLNRPVPAHASYATPDPTDRPVDRPF